MDWRQRRFQLSVQCAVGRSKDLSSMELTAPPLNSHLDSFRISTLIAEYNLYTSSLKKLHLGESGI